MSRIYTLGFEIDSTDDGVEFENIYDAASISADEVRSGNFAGKISTLSSGTLQGFKTTTDQIDADTYYRAYVNFETLPSAENRFIGINPDLVYTTIDNSGTLKLYDEDGQISGTTTLSIDTWYRIELKVLIAGGGADTVELKVDGSTIATSSTRNLSTTPDTFYVGGNLNSESQTTGTWYFDDLAINDGGGDYQNDYAGAGTVEYLFPIQNSNLGGTHPWVVGAGRTAGDDDNYSNINSNPPNDTTYIGSTTSNDKETSSHTQTGMSHLDVASVVQLSVRWRNDVSTASGLTVAPIIIVTPGDIVGTTTTLNSTDWKTNSSSTGGSGMFPRLTTYQQNKPNIDYMDVGVKIIDGTSANYIEVSSVWVIVEYTTRPTPPSFASDEFVMYVHSGIGTGVM